MTKLETAIEKIKKNWDEVFASQKNLARPGAYYDNTKNVVWIVGIDTADSYEVHEEWVGLKKDGTLVWAYASGCSCWDGDYEVVEHKHYRSFKSFTFNHDQIRDSWKESILKFSEDYQLINL